MNRKKILILIAIFAIFSAVILMAVFLGSNGAKVPPIKSPAAVPSPSIEPTGTAVAQEREDRDISESGHDRGIKEYLARYPAIRQLPHKTRYWSLQVYGEVKQGKLPLLATVRVKESQSAKDVFAKQRVYVEKYLSSIKQKAGTYKLFYRSEQR